MKLKIDANQHEFNAWLRDAIAVEIVDDADPLRNVLERFMSDDDNPQGITASEHIELQRDEGKWVLFLGFSGEMVAEIPAWMHRILTKHSTLGNYTATTTI